MSLFLPAVFEVPKGAVNGANQIFLTSTTYKSGSVILFLNGLSKRADFDDGWTELGQKKVRLKMPPLTGDVVQLYYIPL